MTATDTTINPDPWAWLTPDRQLRINECAESAARHLLARSQSTATADDIASDMLTEIHAATDPRAIADDGRVLGTLARMVGKREARKASAALGILESRGPRSDQSRALDWSSLTETDRAAAAARLTIGRISDRGERFIRGEWRAVFAVDSAGVCERVGPSARDKVDAVLGAHTTRNATDSDRAGQTITGAPVPAGVVTTRYRPNANMGAAFSAVVIRGIRHRDSDAGVGAATLHAVHSAESVLIRDAAEWALTVTAGPLLAECAPHIAERVVTRSGKVRNAGRVNMAQLSAAQHGRADAALAERTRREIHAQARAAESAARDLFTYALAPSHHAGTLDGLAAYCAGAENAGRPAVPAGHALSGVYAPPRTRARFTLSRVLAAGRTYRVAQEAERAAWQSLTACVAPRDSDARSTLAAWWRECSHAASAALESYLSARDSYRRARV